MSSQCECLWEIYEQWRARLFYTSCFIKAALFNMENKCPLCGKVNPETEWVCEDCGATLPNKGRRDLTPAPAVPGSSAVSGSPVSSYGSSPGIQPGLSQGRQDRAPDQADQAQRDKRTLGALLVAAVLVVSCVGIFAVRYFMENARRDAPRRAFERALRGTDGNLISSVAYLELDKPESGYFVNVKEPWSSLAFEVRADKALAWHKMAGLPITVKANENHWGNGADNYAAKLEKDTAFVVGPDYITYQGTIAPPHAWQFYKGAPVIGGANSTPGPRRRIRRRRGKGLFRLP